MLMLVWSKLRLRCNALRMMTGNAEAYLSAFARCWPPQPSDEYPPCLWLYFLTRRYSIMHWRKRMRLGMAIISGTINCPPHPRSGLLVADFPDEKNMQSETKRSPKTLA